MNFFIDFRSIDQKKLIKSTLNHLSSLSVHIVLVLASILLMNDICISGTPYWREYPNPGNSVLQSIAGQVDCDNDGYADVIIGEPFETSGGRVWVYSNKTGNLLHAISTPDGNINFGFEVENLGDINSDNHDDFLVTASEWTFLGAGNGYVGRQWVYSGLDASELIDNQGAGCPYADAYRVDGGADIDGDGIPDYIVHGRDCSQNNGGTKTIFKMPTGDTLYAIRPGSNKPLMTMFGDVTGDGRDDFAISGNSTHQIYSGMTGLEVKTLLHGASSNGKPIRDAGDVDGDGINDIIASGPDSKYQATIYKGGTFVPLHTFTNADSTNPTFGWHVAGLGDVDGDGKSDVAISGSTTHGIGGDFEWFFVFSGDDGSVLASDTLPVKIRTIAPAGDANNDGYGDLIVLGSGIVRIYTFSPDTDGDGVMDVHDNCPNIANADQTDNDGDGYGSFCDCNDNDPDINPDTEWYEDTDNDGYGNPSSVLTQCTQPSGYVSDSTDCDDTDPSLNPLTTWYADFDGDGFGNPNQSAQQCDPPTPDWVLDNSDCDDADNSVSTITWYEDSDGDGYGNASSTLDQCTQPGGYVSDDTDCDDTDSQINPATEWYEDADADGWGDPGSTLTQCTQPSGYVLNPDDNCPNDFNPLLEDKDQDGIGDACDPICCGGEVAGNVDCDFAENVDIGDLTRLIDFLFISFDPLCCEGEANVDGAGLVDIGDITRLIDYLFISFDPLITCN